MHTHKCSITFWGVTGFPEGQIINLHIKDHSMQIQFYIYVICAQICALSNYIIGKLYFVNLK